jgi:hypothetical protein
MNETIKAIKSVDGLKLEEEKNWRSYEGFEVETDQQKILVLVDENSCCCERFGYISTPDDTKEFIGSKLLKVEIVDEVLNKAAWDKQFEYGLDHGGVIFVNFETDQGLFQLTVYNSHNGYYGHNARVISRDLNISERL